MTGIRILFARSAFKSFLKLNASSKNKVSKAVEHLAKNPLVGERLKGELQGLYRLRVWPYRIVYKFSSKDEIIEIVAIGHRQGVYK